MLERRPQHARRHSEHPPFARILCAVDGSEGSDAAVRQAIAIADGDASIVFACAWGGEEALARRQDPEAADEAVALAREAGAQAQALYLRTERLAEALVAATVAYDLVVIAGPHHSRGAGIVLGEIATLLLHRCAVPVLVARERALDAGIVAATRGLPADRAALTAAAHLAARLAAELTVLHVTERDDARRRDELTAELANARALLGRRLDYVEFDGPAARAIVDVTEGDGAGLVVVGSGGKQGLSALGSVSERVAHLAPCSVLVLRDR